MVVADASHSLTRPRIESYARARATRSTTAIGLGETVDRHERRAPAFAIRLTIGVSGLGSAKSARSELPGGETGIAAATLHRGRSRGVSKWVPHRYGERSVRDRAPEPCSTTAIAMSLSAIEALSGFPAVRGRTTAMSRSADPSSAAGEARTFPLASSRKARLAAGDWASSASLRADDSQMETPWHSSALVLFDGRRRVTRTRGFFERAVREGVGFAMNWTGLPATFGSDPASSIRGAGTASRARRRATVAAIDLRASSPYRARAGGGARSHHRNPRPKGDRGVAELLSQQYRTPGSAWRRRTDGAPILSGIPQLSIKTVIAGSGQKSGPPRPGAEQGPDSTELKVQNSRRPNPGSKSRQQ